MRSEPLEKPYELRTLLCDGELSCKSEEWGDKKGEIVVANRERQQNPSEAP